MPEMRFPSQFNMQFLSGEHVDICLYMLIDPSPPVLHQDAVKFQA